MRTLTAIGAALAVVGIATAASAADMPVRNYTKAPAYAPPALYNWTGFYAGVNAGGAWSRAGTNFGDASGFVGGGQIGYNWQAMGSPLVLGLEADMQATGADDTFAPYKFSNPWFGTLRGRAGMAWNNVLVYITGGIAYGGLKGESGALSETKTHIGWTLGTGVEFGLAQQWSAKIEYLYADLSNRTYSITGVGNGLETNMIRVGVNYRF